ncbi:c-type cytochrome [Spirosoma oryzicola]|uniref:c-type cytochrome n=1 Tax=Spirosoma oryzicola TaxID=2898794 RepID=UPI001E4A8418|nr:cytochrome c [Spirosoma oryzicola]UHG94993.1 cytochrome c [Spirosoma oryzicola]
MTLFSDACSFLNLMIDSSLNPLVKALWWLIQLLGLSLVLLVVGLICLDSLSEPVDSGKPPVLSYADEPVKPIASLSPGAKKGKLLFTNHCQQCHELSTVKAVGPGLLGVSGRVPDQVWLRKWILNPSALLDSGDAYAKQMVKSYSPVVMPGFPALGEDDVKSLVDYIDSYESGSTSFVQ